MSEATIYTVGTSDFDTEQKRDPATGPIWFLLSGGFMTWDDRLARPSRAHPQMKTAPVNDCSTVLFRVQRRK